MKSNPPLHHMPIVQSLDLATHPATTDAWEEFWLLVKKYAETLRQRRAMNEEIAEPARAQKERA